MKGHDLKQTHHLSRFLEALQRQGRLTFSPAEAIEVLGVSDIAFSRAAQRLIKKKKLIHPIRGFYVIVPFEQQVSGAPPASSFIDALMNYKQQPYYVGVLSAASLYGASHQGFQELQVVTSGSLRTIEAGRSRIRFVTKINPEKIPIQLVCTPTGDISVSTPEATAFDLLLYPYISGSLFNIASTLIELSDKIDSKRLAASAEIFSECPLAQRLGYLLDTFVGPRITADLHYWMEKQRPRWVPLRPSWMSASDKQSLRRNQKWHIIVNEEVGFDGRFQHSECQRGMSLFPVTDTSNTSA